MLNDKTNKVNLLQIEKLSNQEWFSNFEELEDPLTKCLLLVAVMSSQGIISSKEALQFKEFLMRDTLEVTIIQMMKSFLRSKSLFTIRSEMRGHLGFPRMRQNDSQAKLR